jgi:hypothetical protein
MVIQFVIPLEDENFVLKFAKSLRTQFATLNNKKLWKIEVIQNKIYELKINEHQGKIAKQ